MKNVFIISGCSGSGKSTYAKKIPHSSVVSADDYFINKGEYKFDPSRLSEAHGACFRRFIEILDQYEENVIVDNTNTTAIEVSPYILGAQAYGYHAEILMFSPKMYDQNDRNSYIRECAARNKHGVSEKTVIDQCARLMKFDLMPWWKITYLESEFG